MGRKLSQTSVKISKKEKKDFNSLIRLQRPKVYITDSSSFKNLVQDLTGYEISNITVTTISSQPHQQQRAPVVHVEEYHVEPERSTTSSVDVSTDASLDSSAVWNQEIFMNDQEFNQLCYQMYADDATATTSSTTNISEGSSPPSTADQMVDMLPFQDFESWLLGNEPFDAFINHGYDQIDQEISKFDYDLSGLL